MFTNFDCSAFFVRDPDQLVRTFAINPEYLRTAHDGGVSNFRDWGIQLGRRFRALKLWFVIRVYGVEGIRARVRRHLELAQRLRGWIETDGDFELMAPTPLNLVCFRWRPETAGVPVPESTSAGHPGLVAAEASLQLDLLNERLLRTLNDSGQVYLTHTRLGGAYVLRMCVGQTETTEDDVAAAWSIIRETADRLRSPNGE
jgi:aromatic-L-amino-acid decarboxylase